MAYQYEQEKAPAAKNHDGIMVDPPSRLDYHFLVSNNLPIYVLNRLRPLGSLTLTMKLQHGDTRPLRIPREAARRPFCVTEEGVSIQDLQRGGRDLWAALNKQVLQLVWPGDAELMLGRSNSSEGSKPSEFSAAAAVSERVQAAEKAAQKTAARVAQLEQVPNNESAESYHPKVMDLVARMQADELRVEQAIDEFELLLEEATSKDFEYAAAHAKAGKLRDWLQKQAATMRPPTPKAQKPKQGDEVQSYVAPRSKSANSWDDDDSDLTEEEKAQVAIQAAEARARQKLGG